MAQVSAGKSDVARPKVVLTDYPWATLDVEHEILGAAGIDLVAGAVSAGTAREIERLVAAADPVAIMTCWAEVSAEAVVAPSELKLVARLGVGLDNIAVATATARGAWVTNIPDYCVAEVSDHAIGMLLAHYRGIVRLDAATKANGWRPDSGGLERIGDLTVAIVGYGRIGRETGRKLRAFGCSVLGVGRHYRIDDGVARPCDLASAAAHADVIILHAPLSDATFHIIDREFLAGCRRKPLLINVSRGGLVDNDALREALANGQLRGAALDVIEGEPAPPADLCGMANVIVTPHVAFASTASMIELRRRACEEVVRAVRGEPLQHPCNMPAEQIPLDGGVASDIHLVDGPEGPIVIKKALPKLKVATDWFSDPARSTTEVAAIGAFTQLLGPDVVPEILWVRREDNSFAMRMVDPRLRNWKKDLLAGQLNVSTAARLGGLLGLLHRRSAAQPDMAQRFADQRYFDQLRTEPFFLRVAGRMPELAPAIIATANGMASRRSALVHGDFSPKNILADGGDVVILDFEVTHWGDPRFDLAFMLSHLTLKALRRDAATGGFFALMGAFVDAYREEGPAVLDTDLMRLLGCLILARIEGSSPVDYLTDLDQTRATTLARGMLTQPAPSLDTFLKTPSELI
jgi:D-3-phosphoglycerate dehydrogenase